MPKRVNDGSIKLKFPVPAERRAGQQQERYYAALFIAETYKLNPTTNLTKARTAVEEGWKNFALLRWPERVDDKMIELRTPRARRLWADLWLQYSTYTQAASCRLPPLQQIVNFAFGGVEKVAVLFGHPGFVIWVPFYGDLSMQDLNYSYMNDGICAMNPEVSITPHIVESIFIRIVWNEYWAESEANISSFIDRQLLAGHDARRGFRVEPLFITDEIPPEIVMIIPEVANSYEEFYTACHYLNPRSSITREQVYESYRWLLTLKLGLTGYALVEALKGALPTDIDAYHDAVKEVGATLSQQILDRGAPPSTEPDKRFFSITYACRGMLKTTTTHGILPLIRLPYTPTAADKGLKKTVMAYFSQQYRRLNSSVTLTKADVDEAWGALLGMPLPAPAAGLEAAPEDTVAVKAED